MMTATMIMAAIAMKNSTGAPPPLGGDTDPDGPVPVGPETDGAVVAP